LPRSSSKTHLQIINIICNLAQLSYNIVHTAMFEEATVPRAKVTKDDIFTAAHEISLNREKPTLAAIRKKLGAGSQSTIHKYLKEWQNASPGDELEVEDNCPSIPYIYREAMERDKIKLEGQLISLRSSNETLSFSYQKSQSKNLKLKNENEAMSQALLKAEHTCEVLKVKEESFETLVSQLKDSHEKVMEKLINDNRARISELMLELKNTMLDSKDKSQSLSSKLHDEIMLEKINVQNEIAKVATLKKDLQDANTQIQKLKAKNDNTALMAKLKKLTDENCKLVGRLTEGR